MITLWILLYMKHEKGGTNKQSIHHSTLKAGGKCYMYFKLPVQVRTRKPALEGVP